MPRLFDFDNKEQAANRQAYADGQTFPYLPKKRTGKNEVDLREIHGPHGLFLFDGENHQFKRLAEDASAYRNEAADEIFEWLDNNAQGRWHWMEHSSNHGHSLATNIWVEEDADAQSLLAAFPGKLAFNEKQHAENQEIRTKFVTGESGLHPALNAGFLSYMIEWNDDESRRYIASIGDKPGFPKVFAGSIGELRKRGEIDENILLDRLAGMIDGLIPAEGREQVVAYLDRGRTPFVDAMFERLQSPPTPRL
ncbi:hypothetical protein [Rhizobium sp. MHM7A]|uniref:hypothetical protein n=1 Tax=Rhizobium sp. MHM7A TaxID=2583233 RepID=UPI001106477C|nr:hypothetical protein [Rhizobium sp. MHM7A]